MFGRSVNYKTSSPLVVLYETCINWFKVHVAAHQSLCTDRNQFNTSTNIFHGRETIHLNKFSKLKYNSNLSWCWSLKQDWMWMFKRSPVKFTKVSKVAKIRRAENQNNEEKQWRSDWNTENYNKSGFLIKCSIVLGNKSALPG